MLQSLLFITTTLFASAQPQPDHSTSGWLSTTPAAFDECGWFLCKPPVTHTTLTQITTVALTGTVLVARDECGWFLCKPPVRTSVAMPVTQALV